MAVYSAPTLFATGLINNPQDMDIDSSNNLFIANSGTNSVVKITPTGSQTNVVNLPNVSSVTVDAAGNIYSVSATSTVVYKNGAIWAQSPLIQNPASLALDSSGNLYVLCTGSNSIIQILAH